MQALTGEFIKRLAAANGIDLPDERVDLVRPEYESLMRSVAIISALAIPGETEPALGQSLAPPAIVPPDARR